MIYYSNPYTYVNNILQCKKLTSATLVQKQVDALVKLFIYDKNKVILATLNKIYVSFDSILNNHF